MNFLNDNERAVLRAQHKKERDGRVRDRIKAVLLSDKGWTHQQIADALLINDETVRIHLKDYELSKKLCPESGGSEEKLSKDQNLKLEAHLQEHTYLYVKDIVRYVEVVFGINYSVPGMREWLKRHGFSYKKPAVVPGKANQSSQEQWIAEYKALKNNLSEDESVCFIDGVHPTHNVQPTYGWIKTGFRKEIPTNTGRSRINLSGALDVDSYKITYQTDVTLDASSTIRFFKKIEDAYPTKKTIHVFCDNARYYKNKAVTGFLKNSKIKLHFLPPYSPNLNPIERLWKWMKERVIYNTYYPGFDHFRSAILGFFAVLQNLPEESVLAQEFRSRIRDKFRPIGAPVTNF